MRSFLALCIFVLFATPLSAQTSPGWIADAKTGCRVFNAQPQPSESISWTGSCNGGLAQGQGIVHWFQNGKPNGTYEGVFSGGKMANGGIETFPGGRRYQSDFRDNTKTGQGVMIFPDGSRYQGLWLDDKPNGFGTLTMKSGEVYSGAWTNGCFRQGNRRAVAHATAKQCGFE